MVTQERATLAHAEEFVFEEDVSKGRTGDASTLPSLLVMGKERGHQTHKNTCSGCLEGVARVHGLSPWTLEVRRKRALRVWL